MSDEAAKNYAGSLSFVASNTRSSAHFLRIRFAAYVERCVPAADLASEIVLAVGEALANAAEHGHRPRGILELNAKRIVESAEFERLEVEIIDDGRGFAPHPHAAQPIGSGSRGFGIHIMRSIMDSVEFHDGGRRVMLMKRLRRP